MGDPKRVEIKLNVGKEHVADARALLGLTDETATRAAIWFCDRVVDGAGEPRLALTRDDLIVRVRRKEGADSDTTVKLRRPAPLRLPHGWKDADAPAELKIEGDWAGTSRNVSASLDSSVTAEAIDDALQDAPPVDGSLFSDDQHAFAAAVLGGDEDAVRDLRPFGPIQALRWQEAMRDDFGREVGAEQWVADDLVFLELSIRAKFDAAERWQERFVSWASTRVEVAPVGITKTQAVLEHFLALLDA
jgi:hypothetical protein